MAPIGLQKSQGWGMKGRAVPPNPPDNTPFWDLPFPLWNPYSSAYMSKKMINESIQALFLTCMVILPCFIKYSRA